MIKTTAALAACLLAITPALAQQPVYTVTGLGNMGLDGGVATRVSENGRVVGLGYALDATTQLFTQYTPFVDSQGVATPTPTYNGLNIWASDINSAGQVVGYSYTFDAASGGAIYQRALLLDASGQIQDLGTLGGTRARARARAINELGQVAGTSRVAGSSQTHAFRYDNGVMVDLGASAGVSTSASVINNLGQVAGFLVTTDGNLHAAAFNADGVVTDLGTLGGSTSVVNGINDRSQIVGYAETALAGPDFAITHAYLYDGGVMRDLGSFAGKDFTSATGINNHGQIVGLAFSGTEFDNEVFLWQDGQMHDINRLLDPARTAGWTITGAYDINDRGQIVGDGIFNGVRQAVLLTPVPELPPAAMLAAGTAALAWLRRRRSAASSLRR